MGLLFFDTETCGFHGPAILIQYALDDGPIKLHEVWNSPVKDTLNLIEEMMTHTVVGFNLAFDHFHLCQLYTTMLLLQDKDNEPNVLEYAELEPFGRDGPCLKPASAFDVMLHARKGPYQSTMDRGDIRIRRVPTVLAWQLAEELEKRIPLKQIYFARRKNPGPKWQIFDLENADGDIDPNFKDLVLKFAPSTALKALAADALGIQEDAMLLFEDIELPAKLFPVEVGYAPFARAIGDRHNWRGAWPDVIRHHISHWHHNTLARQYAQKDVHYTRALYEFFGSPPTGDTDSVLACMVGAVRWRGFKVNLEALRKLRVETLARKIKVFPDGTTFTIPTSPKQARIYISEKMDAIEKLGMEDTKRKTTEDFAVSTKRVLLEDMVKNWRMEDGSPHPAAIRAGEVLAARQANYEADLFDKFLLAGRFHASFAVIGTLSSRMAGTDDLNPQGIKRTKSVRECFTLAWKDKILCGGDFAGFEVTLAEACYNDPQLRKDLLSGKKIHGLFGVHVYPNMTYEEILATEHTENDCYTKSKSAVFAMFYGGEGYTLQTRLGVSLEVADAAYAKFCEQYPQVGIARRKVFDMFCSMRQPGGIGTRVEWHEPSDYIESMFGFRRYFSLENQICKALYDLANDPPPAWRTIRLRVQRRDRTQTATGAVASALYGAAFGLQASNMRAAANHVIQSSGATITKDVQRAIWDIQPIGVGEWKVQPINVHDEIQCVTDPNVVDQVAKAVYERVETFRPKVPLIQMKWKTGLQSWADK